jgi:predicted DsbA family dithiol-disulfide isomerase
VTAVNLARVPLEITLFTDPACPFAFSSEPIRRRLRWHYGDQLVWRTRMIVLTLEPGEAERLAEGAPNLQRRFGMPIDPAPYARTASSEPACRAVVAARLHAPEKADALLRRLRVRVMQNGLLDDPELIGAAAHDVGLDPGELAAWCALADVEAALQSDIAAARDPAPAARRLDHKLGGPKSARRYTTPSYEFGPGREFVVPGFNPVETYETAIANIAPQLERRPKPVSVVELLEWAEAPLATAEVALIAQLDARDARAALAKVATPIAAGADFYWHMSSTG